MPSLNATNELCMLRERERAGADSIEISSPSDANGDDDKENEIFSFPYQIITNIKKSIYPFPSEELPMNI